MKNYFEELAKVSIKGKTEKKGNYDYLSWANAWAMIKLKHPNAQRNVYEDQATGLNFFTDGKTAYVKVGVVVNDIEHIDYLPIMDYRNNSLKIEKITSMDVNTSIQRSTAKACAMHGLGLSLWVGEDITAVDTETPAKKKSKPQKAKLVLDTEDWANVLKYIAENKDLGFAKILKNVETKFDVTLEVKKMIKVEVDG